MLKTLFFATWDAIVEGFLMGLVIVFWVIGALGALFAIICFGGAAYWAVYLIWRLFA